VLLRLRDGPQPAVWRAQLFVKHVLCSHVQGSKSTRICCSMPVARHDVQTVCAASRWT